jgi:hypothetical protein
MVIFWIGFLLTLGQNKLVNYSSDSSTGDNGSGTKAELEERREVEGFGKIVV